MPCAETANNFNQTKRTEKDLRPLFLIELFQVLCYGKHMGW